MKVFHLLSFLKVISSVFAVLLECENSETENKGVLYIVIVVRERAENVSENATPTFYVFLEPLYI